MIPGVLERRYCTRWRAAVSQVEEERLLRITGYSVSPWVLTRDWGRARSRVPIPRTRELDISPATQVM